ncbi:uncharacterized protein [Henckelia pumila]|uniref:uncharacterized protein isoform X2 n=1 Tax=Henckelia pumila TaxID=405737 RepID=UPI003C6E09DA
MYNGIGLQTARGSGTNGYVQTNKFFIKPRTNKVVMDSSKGFDSGQGMAGVTRKPNKDILEHDRKRKIQLKLLVLEEKLIDQGYTDAEIAEKLDEARKALDVDEGSHSAVIPEKVSVTQTHQIAALKERQMETLKNALGIESEGDREKKHHDAMATSIEENDDEDEPRNIHKKNTADVVNPNTSGQYEPKFHNKDKIRGARGDSSDSDSDEKRDRKAKSKPKKDGRRAVTDADSKIGVRKRREETSRTQKKVVKHDSDSSGSEAPSGRSSDFGSESDHDKNLRKTLKRYDSDDDNSSDSSLKRSKLKHPPKSRRRDDYSSDEDHGYKTKKSKNKHRYSYDDDSSDEGNHHRQKRTQPKYSRQHDSDGSSDEGPKNRTQRLKGPSRSKQHDSDEELHDDRSKKDDIREKHSKKIDVTFKKLELLYKSKEDESGDELERGRWDGEPDVKPKKLYQTKDKGSGGPEIELDRQNKSYREENHARDSRPPRHGGKNLDADDHGDVLHSRKELRHDNRRDEHYREYHGRSRREWEDEEDLRGRKHDRDGGKDSSRKREEKLEHQPVKRGKDQEEEHMNRKDEREREHTLKRGRYDDARSTGRRDDDRNDDRRPRYRS